MKKLIVLLVIVLPGCVDEHPSFDDNLENRNAAYLNRDLIQERVAEELTKIRQLLERQERRYEKD